MVFSSNIKWLLRSLRYSLSLRAPCRLTGVDPEWLATQGRCLNAPGGYARTKASRLEDGAVSLQYVRAL